MEASEGVDEQYRASLRAHFAMLAFSFMISTSFTVGEAITAQLDPVALTFLRFVLAALIFLAIIIFTGRKITRPNGSEILRYCWLALLLVLYFVLMFEALRWTDSLSTGAIFTLAPPMTALISWLFLRQHISLHGMIAMAIAGLGAIWVMFDGDAEKLARFSIGKGEVIFFLGAVAYAAYSPSVRKLHGNKNLVELTFWTLIACIILLGAFGWRTILSVDWQAVPLSIYLGIAHLALFTTAMSFYLIQYASIYLPSGKVMAYTYLIPAFIVVQKIMLGAPVPSWSVLAGVLVIASAMIILQRS
ncbi:MAG: DMT family transporter [Hyphomicrobiales bacterium]